MSLSMLTTSGWVWLWLTLAAAITTFATPSKERREGAELVTAGMVAWLLWLMTPTGGA